MKITEVRKNYSLSIMYINCKQNYNRIITIIFFKIFNINSI